MYTIYKRYVYAMRFLLLMCLIVITGCSTVPTNESSKDKVFLIDPSTIAFYAGTNNESFIKLTNLLHANKNTVKQLTVFSGGGDVHSAIKIGTLVHEMQLKVNIKNMCLSSCANYIATASPNVVVQAGAILGWHGGALQPLYQPLEFSIPFYVKALHWLFGDDEEMKRSQKQGMKEWQIKEAEFFDLVQVNQAVTILGMTPGYLEKRSTPFFSYDIRTLKRLGLKIHFEDNEPNTKTPSGEEILQIFKFTQQELDTTLALHAKKLTSI